MFCTFVLLSCLCCRTPQYFIVLYFIPLETYRRKRIAGSWVETTGFFSLSYRQFVATHMLHSVFRHRKLFPQWFSACLVK
jgi:hypothetical protein